MPELYYFTNRPLDSDPIAFFVRLESRPGLSLQVRDWLELKHSLNPSKAKSYNLALIFFNHLKGRRSKVLAKRKQSLSEFIFVYLDSLEQSLKF